MRKKKMPDDEPWIRIQNVVASASLNHRIDIKAVCKAFPKTEYRPKIFPGLVFRLKRPKTATLIFNSGKMVCTGAKSEKDSIRAVKSIVSRLKKAKIIIRGKPEIKIVNIVASANLGGKVDLYGLYQKYGEGMGGRMMYEPEQFPGLIYRMEEPKAVILIFASGKLVCTGARKEEDIHRAVEKLHERLDHYNVIMYRTRPKKRYTLE
jgi:transcription initiation factor TFIID TATA-box-binding protein